MVGDDVEGRRHGGGVPGGIHHHLRFAVVTEGRDSVQVVTLHLQGRIGTQLPGKFKSGVVHIQRQGRHRTVELGPLHGQEADDARTQRGDAFAQFDAGLAHSLEGNGSHKEETGLFAGEVVRYGRAMLRMHGRNSLMFDGHGQPVPLRPAGDFSADLDHFRHHAVAGSHGIVAGGVFEAQQEGPFGAGADQRSDGPNQQLVRCADG